MLAIGAILALTGVNLPLGIALMAAGGVSLAAAIAPNWDYLSQEIQKVFKSVGDFIVSTWETIEEAITSAWVAVSDWFDENIIQNITAAWSEATRWLSSVWDSIKNAVTNAWDSVSKWFDDAKQAVGSAWSSALTWMTETWNSIQTAVSNAWDSAAKWFDDAKSKIGGAWSAATTWLSGTWDSIKTTVSNAWDSVAEWWNNGIGEWISSAWEGVKSTFSDIFSPVKDALDWLKEILGFDGKNVNMGVNVAISETSASSQVVSNVVTTNASQQGGSSGGGGSIIDQALHLIGVPGYATGAYGISKGQLFIANEEGAELIGNIGGNTSVANNQQIVDGISEGVRDANAEQNALLRQQNELLRAILAKDNGISPSVGLGRTVRQSLDLYSRVGG